MPAHSQFAGHEVKSLKKLNSDIYISFLRKLSTLDKFMDLYTFFLCIAFFHIFFRNAISLKLVQ